ncbi:hypothetical protein [Dyella tabacisoli]|uniref:Uncharacterized protein n=1 Tax=Dyella tabacisoli TaxID=2282381 RepID=A0A369UKE6_9GAMM|nr:hypothetical protein [Dyella tabacisoli]RDD80977.1 hypothetical protein DVJ77_14860 [Dyella tabacisoli]
MSLYALATLFNGPNQTGSSRMLGLGASDRYRPDGPIDLLTAGLYNFVTSGSLICSDADLNLVLFQNDDFSGSFFQLSKSRDSGNASYWHTGPAASALVIASNRRNTTETRLSYSDLFRGEWDSFLDGKLAGTAVSREGEPLLTWRMFPTNDQWLDAGRTYLRIHQPLHVHLDWWPDYSASMDYHLVLYVDGNHHLRCWVADWECWVDGGAKNGRIHSSLDPQVAAGMPELQNQINGRLSQLDGLGAVKDVYYLPGRQLASIGTGTLGGNTSDDVTIVVVS